jgi:hypothetical protein
MKSSAQTIQDLGGACCNATSAVGQNTNSWALLRQETVCATAVRSSTRTWTPGAYLLKPSRAATMIHLLLMTSWNQHMSTDITSRVPIGDKSNSLRYWIVPAPAGNRDQAHEQQDPHSARRTSSAPTARNRRETNAKLLRPRTAWEAICVQQRSELRTWTPAALPC